MAGKWIDISFAILKFSHSDFNEYLCSYEIQN